MPNRSWLPTPKTWTPPGPPARRRDARPVGVERGSHRRESPPVCARSPGCPTRSVRCCAATPCPMGCSSAPAAGSARRGRHDLRGPAQRHRRRFRFGAQVRQCRAAARELVGGEVQPGARRRAAGCVGQRGPARRRGPAAFGRRSVHGDPPDSGPRPGRRGDSARGSQPDRRGGPRRPGAHHRDRRRQLSRLRRTKAPTWTWRSEFC